MPPASQMYFNRTVCEATEILRASGFTGSAHHGYHPCASAPGMSRVVTEHRAVILTQPPTCVQGQVSTFAGLRRSPHHRSLYRSCVKERTPGVATDHPGKQTVCGAGTARRGDPRREGVCPAEVAPRNSEQLWHMESREGGKSIWGQELCLNFVLFSSKRKYYFTL